MTGIRVVVDEDSGPPSKPVYGHNGKEQELGWYPLGERKKPFFLTFMFTSPKFPFIIDSQVSKSRFNFVQFHRCEGKSVSKNTTATVA